MVFETFSKENRVGDAFAVIISAITVFSIIFFSSNLQFGSDIQTYILALSFIVIIAFFISKNKKGDILRTIDFGSFEKGIGGAAVGAIIGLFIATMSTPQSTLYLPNQAAETAQGLGVYLVNIFAPLMEALFFRGFLLPTSVFFFGNLLKNKSGKPNRLAGVILGFIFTAALFASVHTNVFFQKTQDVGATGDLFLITMLFSLMWSALAWYFGIGVEVGWHFVNNITASGFPDVLPITIIAFMAYTAAFYVVNKALKRVNGNG